jgi:hypothetical protein
MLGEIRSAISSLTSNLPFIMEHFDRHMEKRIDNAKVEIGADMNRRRSRAGFELEGGEGPLVLDHKKDE